MIFAPGSRLEKIGPKSFCNTEIEKIIIPKNVTEIKDSAFHECGNLKEVVFEDGSRLETIGEIAFGQCKKLTKINLPDGLKKIGIGCFNSSSLEELILPDSVKEIGRSAFS